MLPFHEKIYETISKQGELVFVADVGGTNSNFAICRIENNQVSRLYSLHIKSHFITDFAPTVQEILAYIKQKFDLALTRACFGIAGIVSKNQDYAKPTNLSFGVDLHAIKQLTSLQDAIIINDFVMLGYGIEVLDPKNIVSIHQGVCIPYGNKAIIGAGTGLGKTILVWSKEKKLYKPIPSEGGHADAAVQYPQELQLVECIRQHLNYQGSVSWEEILSGRGIQHIYCFLRSNTNTDHSKHAQ